MKTGFFTDENGIPSSTRLTGFIIALSLIATVILNIVFKSDWKLALVSDSILAVVVISCFFLRGFSLTEVSELAKNIKKG